ncbi:hypothetical protein CEY16_00775 [Halalkalibacillus sediminis]|uniref:Uncharacterized protein n=1 Tax=Halalkalibacillus sediminis TaxID=2018042 RepID=A0A2I0QVG8_9BACI|nr:hypothetical protein [Halalkalibacillus sediminis]PKR78325.1 hypothetical protein CEY16_00775 [Halalkalibacillus sediminis]
MKRFQIALIVGVVSATAMGTYLYWIEQMTGKQLYTLLMNIDFIYQPDDNMNSQLFAVFEFSLHVLVAIIMVLIYLFMIQREFFKNRRFELAAIITFVAFLTYFPLTILAQTETPAITDFVAISDWFLAHVIFFFIFYYFTEFLMKKVNFNI